MQALPELPDLILKAFTINQLIVAQTRDGKSNEDVQQALQALQATHETRLRVFDEHGHRAASDMDMAEIAVDDTLKAYRKTAERILAMDSVKALIEGAEAKKTVQFGEFKACMDEVSAVCPAISGYLSEILAPFIRAQRTGVGSPGPNA